MRLTATVLPDGDRDTDLWVRDGAISDEPVSGAEHVPGRYVLHGLVDAHAHLTIDVSGTGLPAGSDDLVAANLRAQREAGVLLVRDVGRVRDEPLDVDGGVLQAGRFLGPEGGWVEGLHVPTPPERLLHAVRAQLASGVAWVKVIGDWKHDGEIRLNYDPALLREVAEVTHAHGRRFAMHAIGADACRAAVECGADSVEHGCSLDEDQLRAMAERGTAWTPTLSAVTSKPNDLADGMRAMLPVARRLGVPVLAGTDTTPHGSVAGEIALLHEFGLDPVDAIRAATTTAREFLGVPAGVDLVTYDADPREDLDVLRHPVAVISNGVRIR
jgi:imidazolonepropionase-like amidohydrolase